MWKRRQLKRNAKAAVKANYWRCVLAALILAAITGGLSGIAGGIGGAAGSSLGIVGSSALPGSQLSGTPAAELTGSADVVAAAEDLISPAEAGSAAAETASWDDVMDQLAKVPEVQALSELLSQMDESDFFKIFAVIGTIVGVILLIAFLVQLLIINPLIAGCKYFFARNCEEKAMAGEVAGGFDRGYGRVVGGMFLKSLFLFFWTLLFIIPGIIKSFSYRMVPYILVDQPELTANQAITRSRQMMKGNKWRAFVLDLSFILWYILSALTLGLVGLFFVHPYYEATNGELYQALKAEHSPEGFAPAGDLPEDDRAEDLPEDVPADVPQDVSEALPQNVPEDQPQDVPADLPEDTVES